MSDKYLVRSSAGKFQTIDRARAEHRIEDLRGAGIAAKLVKVPVQR